MAINKTEHPYEFLVRINDNEISGAIVRRIERFTDSEAGSVISENELPPSEVELTSDELNMIKARLK